MQNEMVRKGKTSSMSSHLSIAALACARSVTGTASAGRALRLKRLCSVSRRFSIDGKPKESEIIAMKYKPVDLSGIKTYPLAERKNMVVMAKHRAGRWRARTRSASC